MCSKRVNRTGDIMAGRRKKSRYEGNGAMLSSPPSPNSAPHRKWHDMNSPYRHSRASRHLPSFLLAPIKRWIPAFAGMTMLGTGALAQIAGPTPPTPPTVTAPPMMQGGQPATAAQPSITQQLQQLLGNNPQAQKAMAQAMVMSNLLGCTEQQAGREATQAFYSHMQQGRQNGRGLLQAGQRSGSTYAGAEHTGGQAE